MRARVRACVCALCAVFVLCGEHYVGLHVRLVLGVFVLLRCVLLVCICVCFCRRGGVVLPAAAPPPLPPSNKPTPPAPEAFVAQAQALADVEGELRDLGLQ